MISFTDAARHSQYVHQLRRWNVRKINGWVSVAPDPGTPLSAPDGLSSTDSMTTSQETPPFTESIFLARSTMPLPALPSPASNEGVQSNLEDDILHHGSSTDSELHSALDSDDKRPHLVPTAKISAAELFFHMGLHSEACHLYEETLEEVNAFFPPSSNIFLALARNSSTLDWLSKWPLGLYGIIHKMLGFSQYGYLDHIKRLLSAVFDIDLYQQLEDCNLSDPNLIPDAIAQLPKDSLSFHFLVYHSAGRLLLKREMPQDVWSFELLNIKDQQLRQRYCDQQIMLHLNKTFLQLRPGAFELRDGILQNRCLQSCFKWSRMKLLEPSILFNLGRDSFGHLIPLCRFPQLYLFCFLWEQWHIDPVTRELDPWTRMGLKPADLIATICHMALSAAKLSIPVITQDQSSQKHFFTATSCIISVILDKPDAELASDFLDAFMCATEAQNWKLHEDINKACYKLATHFIAKYPLVPIKPILRNLFNGGEDTTIEFAGSSHHPKSRFSLVSMNSKVTIAPSISSTNSSLASMRRLADRIRGKYRLSASSRGTSSSLLDQMSIVSERLSILNLEPEELEPLQEVDTRSMKDTESGDTSSTPFGGNVAGTSCEAGSAIGIAF